MTPKESPDISIFSYSEYRVFLKDIYEWRHAKDSKFSHRFIGNKVGVSSSGWFAEILKGRVNLGGNHLIILAKLLVLSDIETDYFEVLVQFNHANSIEEKNRHFRKIISFKEMQVDLVGQEKFELAPLIRTG